MRREPPKTPRATEDEPPPILGTWRLIYVFVFCYLAIVILAFYLFARAFDS
ncbi:MAG: hypothetical protein JOZ32_01560 [Bryobacterales bacterium]|nr:hypothetical protein [Bryobacterales bacterium]